MAYVAATTFAAINAIAISFKFTPPAFKGAQADTGHIAGTHEAGMRRWLAFRKDELTGVTTFLAEGGLSQILAPPHHVNFSCYAIDKAWIDEYLIP